MRKQIFGLCLGDKDEWYFHDDSALGLEDSMGVKRIFAQCLEQRVQDSEDDNTIGLPWYKPWTFYRGESEAAIKAGKGELIVSMQANTPEGLWKVEEWASSGCFALRLYYDV